MSKVIHRAKHVSPTGRVSPLCAPKPRAIDLTRAGWTLRDDAVTCPRCAAIIAMQTTADQDKPRQGEV